MAARAIPRALGGLLAPSLQSAAALGARWTLVGGGSPNTSPLWRSLAAATAAGPAVEGGQGAAGEGRPLSFALLGAGAAAAATLARCEGSDSEEESAPARRRLELRWLGDVQKTGRSRRQTSFLVNEMEGFKPSQHRAHGSRKAREAVAAESVAAQRAKLEAAEGKVMCHWRLLRFDVGMDELASVRHGKGLGDAQRLRALELAETFFKPADHPMWQEKPYKHVYFPELRIKETGHELLLIFRDFFWEAGFRDASFHVIGFSLVKSVRNSEPMHQDKITGRAAFARGGWRLVFDLTGGRTLRIERSRGGVLEEVASFTAPLVCMDALAAGAGCEGTACHGRVGGNGISGVLDISQAINGDVRLGNISHTKIDNFFVEPARPSFLHGLPSFTGGFDAAALLRAQAAAPRLQAMRAAAQATAAAGAAEGSSSAAPAAAGAAPSNAAAPSTPEPVEALPAGSTAAAAATAGAAGGRAAGITIPKHCVYCGSLETTGTWNYIDVVSEESGEVQHLQVSPRRRPHRPGGALGGAPVGAGRRLRGLRRLPACSAAAARAAEARSSCQEGRRRRRWRQRRQQAQAPRADQQAQGRPEPQRRGAPRGPPHGATCRAQAQQARQPRQRQPRGRAQQPGAGRRAPPLPLPCVQHHVLVSCTTFAAPHLLLPPICCLALLLCTSCYRQAAALLEHCSAPHAALMNLLLKGTPAH
ncbi:hypothetical protein ABPG75_003947 [Micractinium tetrahymenae]